MKVCEINIQIKAAAQTFWERVISVNISAAKLPAAGPPGRWKREGSRWSWSMKCSTFFLFYLY